MPWSHHSHSGQFCGHAVDTLEQIVQGAIAKGLTTLCLTEHMPRGDSDLYPEEAQSHNQQTLTALFDAFYHEARRLQTLYASQIHLLVGFEGEWIRPSSLTLIQDLQSKYPVDMFIGSVHHTLTYPIDFDHEQYHRARDLLGGAASSSDEKIFERYFDDQRDMLEALHPPVVGHFDLIRLKASDPNRSFREWPGVWERIERNLKLVVEYGGVLELNSASLRKGMTECYPQVEICRAFKNLGGRFTLSDDSHGIAQVALNYGKMLACVEEAGIESLVCLEKKEDEKGGEKVLERFRGVRWNEISVEELKRHRFWTLQERS